MRLVVFVLLIVYCTCDLQVSIDRNAGKYNISVNNNLWLRSSRLAVYSNDQWYSSNDSSLTLIDTRFAEGNDPNLGTWNETRLIYSLNRNGTISNVTGHIRQWTSYPAITFHLDTGDRELRNDKLLDVNDVRTIFPSFNIEQTDMNDNRGYFTFQGLMMGYYTLHAGIWDSAAKIVTNSLESGPIVLFDLNKKGQGDVIIMSPFSHFMATSLNQQNNIIQYGVMGSITNMPANYNTSMILFYSPHGINKGIHEWGQLMQRAYNRTNQYVLNDTTIKYLGYYTDGGAYYYYNTEGTLNYEDTMLSVYRKIKLPYHYIQLDSWWYYKGIKDGVSQWRARPDIFPDGLPALSRQMERIPLAAHNRYWAIDNVYSDKYAFIFDDAHQSALPVGNDSFWIDLFTEAANDWALIMYEQDWLQTQTTDFTPLHNDIHLGRQWLTSMAEGAEKAGMTIQYCSAFPRHALQSLELPRVTQARVSVDYTFHITRNDAQWAIGVTSLLAYAVGVAPFKDTFWSTSDEPGSAYKPPPRERLPLREIALSVLSTGPVGPGDAINYTNYERIMKCCRQDGLILKPDRPITMIDLLISDWAQNNGTKQGELYSTETTINEQTFHVVFASAMRRDYSIVPLTINAQAGLLWSYDNASQLSTFDDNNPLHVSAANCNSSSFCVWYISPVWQFSDTSNTKYALLGETDKWTVVSRQRITSINTNTEKTLTTISLDGSASETVNLSVYHSKLNIVNVKCVLSSLNGQAQLIISTSNVTCSSMN